MKRENGYSEMLAAMALIGIGCGPVLMGSMFVFGRSYPPERFALMSSLILGVGALGVLAAATPLAYAVEAFGWRASMAAIGASRSTLPTCASCMTKWPNTALVSDAPYMTVCASSGSPAAFRAP